ncbi:MAG TPA: ABC transporter permease [Acidimicrobiales bacterium]|nr:ABC transporter permease [Acidimicrobiales bacterium]
MTRRIVAVVLPPLVGAAVLVVVWQIVAASDSYVLPRPGTVASQLGSHAGTYLSAAGTTLEEAMGGLAAGGAAALGLALLMAQWRVVRRAVLPLALLANVTPIVALAPALIVAFGFGLAPKMVVTALMCFFPALINAVAGLGSADPALLEVLAVLHASPREVLWRVRVPSSLPYLFVAARICFPLSVIGAVVAELVSPGSSSGLGTLIEQAATDAQLDRVYAAVVCLGVIGVALTGLVALAERRVLSWRQADRPR